MSRRDGQMEDPFEEGSIRYVARGVYTSGRRKDQECVIKWLKTGHVDSNTFFRFDLKAVDKALEIIREFNQAEIMDQHIWLNMPAVWVFGGGTGYLSGKKILVEPYIEDFRKCKFASLIKRHKRSLRSLLTLFTNGHFTGNSNTGWIRSSVPWGRVMEVRFIRLICKKNLVQRLSHLEMDFLLHSNRHFPTSVTTLRMETICCVTFKGASTTAVPSSRILSFAPRASPTGPRTWATTAFPTFLHITTVMSFAATIGPSQRALELCFSLCNLQQFETLAAARSLNLRRCSQILSLFYSCACAFPWKSHRRKSCFLLLV